MEEPAEEPPDVNGFMMYETLHQKNECRIPRKTLQFEQAHDNLYLWSEVVAASEAHRVCDTLRHPEQHGASTVEPYDHLPPTRHNTSRHPQQHGASTVEPYDELPPTWRLHLTCEIWHSRQAADWRCLLVATGMEPVC